jgi:hypothetical protein
VLHGSTAVLDRGGRTGTRVAIEQVFRGFAGHDPCGDRVGVLFVAVAGPTNALTELDASALLNRVGRFVGGGEEIRGTAESDVLAGGVTERTHVFVGRLRGAIGVGYDTADIVATEGVLDGVGVRKTAAGAGETSAGGGVDIGDGATFAVLDGAGASRRRGLECDGRRGGRTGRHGYLQRWATICCER